MPVIIILLLFADLAVLMVSFARHDLAWAAKFCSQIDPLCNYPTLLMVVAVLLVGMFFLAR